jgi:hypothetical protein
MVDSSAFEEAEDYLYGAIMPARQAWPEHLREATDDAQELLSRLPEDAEEELIEVLIRERNATDAFHLRVGFELGRKYAAQGWLSRADVCEAVLAAGGNPAQALADLVDDELAEVVALPVARG